MTPDLTCLRRQKERVLFAKPHVRACDVSPMRFHGDRGYKRWQINGLLKTSSNSSVSQSSHILFRSNHVLKAQAMSSRYHKDMFLPHSKRMTRVALGVQWPQHNV
jgi:hypothetical protein